MKGELFRYLNAAYAGRLLGSVLALLALLQVLELLEITTEVLERGLGVAGVARYVALRAPVLLPQSIPLGVLIGAALTLATLAGRSEIIAIRSVGGSLYRVISAFVPATFAAALVLLLVSEFAAPRASEALSRWWAETAPKPAKSSDVPAAWFRVDGDLVSVDSASADGTRLNRVRIYVRDSDARLVSRISAEAAVWSARNWTLTRATELRVAGGAAEEAAIASRSGRTSLTPEAAVNLIRPTGQISAVAAERSLRGRSAAGESPAFYRTRLHRTLAAPAGTLVMLLLAAPIALAGQRGGRQVLWLIGALGAGLAYLLLDGVFTSLAETSVLPAFLGAWIAPLLGAAAAGWFLLKVEG